MSNYPVSSPSIEVENASCPTIFVIDDEKAFCDVVCEILDSLGFQAHFAYSAADALSMLEATIPDLILSDVMMPEIDGLTFIRQLRADPSLSRIPVVVVSAKATNEDRDAARMAGADGFLAKPFSSDELRKTISAHLSAA